MRRRTFDVLLTTSGAVMVVVLVVAGFLLLWGHSFANDNVHHYLAEQRIVFPEKGSKALAPPEIGKYLNKYAGQQLLTGPQAKAYADHFIAVHLKETANGQTYAEVSSKAQANPQDTKLKQQVDTLFKGETLRGLLLEAYAFWKFGQIAMWAAIASFILAGVMLVFVGLGVWHSRHVAPTEQL